ncbi:MAG: exonuclease domain-containing protein [Eubacteriales bacterium]|nr:exonuclease domain-containing protein [Eubacteriales bacterium]
MQYIVFDLEWNIASRAIRVDPEIQAAMPFEIIEIGAVKLNEKFEVISEFTTHVRPKIYRILSNHIAAVTKRFQQSLKFGLPFPQAAQSFLDWCNADGENYALCIWSESDPGVLRSNLAFHGLNDQLPLQCLDVQYVFDELIEQAGMQRSIEYAVDFLRLPKTEPFHQAVKDAWYTGIILQQVAQIAIEEQGIDDLLGIYAYDPNLNRSTKMSMPPATSHDEVLHRLISANLACPACQQSLRPLEPWTRSGNRADARYCCQDHGVIAGKARFRKNEETVLTELSLRLEKGGQGITCLEQP